MFSSYALRIFSQQILSGKDGPKGNKSPICINNKQNFELDVYFLTTISVIRLNWFIPVSKQAAVFCANQ